MRLATSILVVLVLSLASLHGQELEFDDSIAKSYPVHGTFIHTRVINGHSTETLGKGSLDVLFRHRFGYISDGAFNLFGLDVAQMRLALEYGICDRLMVGLGRSTNLKSYDVFLKYKLLSQTTGGSQNTPISVVIVTGALLPSTFARTDRNNNIKNPILTNLMYATEIHVSRKWKKGLSIQLSVSYVHRNSVDDASIASHDFIALGGSIKYKITRRFSILGEYHHNVIGKIAGQQYAPMAIGLDIETGGHHFSLHFTNAQGMSSQTFLTQENGNVGALNLRFGFNLSRRFQLVKEVKGGKIY